eukprot:1136161-Pyramimonas_sp.AAC.1
MFELSPRIRLQEDMPDLNSVLAVLARSVQAGPDLGARVGQAPLGPDERGGIWRGRGTTSAARSWFRAPPPG